MCTFLRQTLADIDPKVANAVGYLANGIVKALQYQDLEERLAAIEEAIGVKNR